MELALHGVWPSNIAKKTKMRNFFGHMSGGLYACVNVETSVEKGQGHIHVAVGIGREVS